MENEGKKTKHRLVPWKGLKERKSFLEWKRNVEPKARRKDIDAFIEAKSKGTMTFHYEGNLIECKAGKIWEPYAHQGRGKRTKIAGFSADSRRRLLRLCACIMETALPLFVTLTYPSVWPDDPKVWKDHLDKFGKWLARAYPNASAIWKLEAQMRGAPHYHLLVWGVSFIPHELLAQRWYEIVGSNDPKHLAAGIQVVATRNKKDVMAYASKKYMGKEVGGFEGVGKFWGVLNRKALPVSKTLSFEVAEVVLVKVRRIFRRLLKSKGIRMRNNRSFTLFSRGHELWSRVIDWAQTEHDADCARFPF